MTPLETQLFNALNEALEWNWLDEIAGPPPFAIMKIEAALLEYERQLEQENNRVNY
jgi:hypothetical protein